MTSYDVTGKPEDVKAVTNYDVTSYAAVLVLELEISGEVWVHTFQLIHHKVWG